MGLKASCLCCSCCRSDSDDSTENDKHEDLTEGKDGNTSKAGDEVEEKGDPIPPTKTVIALLIALRYFKSRTPNEVTVLKGDKMLLLNRKSKDWWFVEVIRTKNQGYIPRSIVARLPTAVVLAAKKPATLVQVHDGKPANLDKTKNEDEADDESKNDSGTENEINNEGEMENEINNEGEMENEINNEGEKDIEVIGDEMEIIRGVEEEDVHSSNKSKLSFFSKILFRRR